MTHPPRRVWTFQAQLWRLSLLWQDIRSRSSLILDQGTWSHKKIAESACLISSTVPVNLFSSSRLDQLLGQYWKALWLLLGLVAPHRYSSWHLLISVSGQLASQLSPLALTLLAACIGLRVEADQWHRLAVKPASTEWGMLMFSMLSLYG